MKAIAIHRDERTPHVIEKPRPEPVDGEVLVRTHRVGIDGTDHGIIDAGHGSFPEGEDHLVLGHEAVGVVEDGNGTGFETGDVVVPTVRRSKGETNEYHERGEIDHTPVGDYVERGIAGAHGFMAEFFTTPAEFLVSLPPEYAEWGFLVEPISISEKAFELAFAARSSFDWRPESAVVLGNGSLGLLTLAMLEADERFDRTYCLGRRHRPDPTIDVIESLDGTYVDSRETPVDELPAAHEGMDFVYEATGYAKHAFESIDALAPSGVAALLGVPDDWEFDVDGGQLHTEMVLHNKAVVGSVNSGLDHFEAAIDTLETLPEWFLEDLVTGVYGFDELEAAFDDGDSTIKTAVQFDTHEER